MSSPFVFGIITSLPLTSNPYLLAEFARYANANYAALSRALHQVSRQINQFSKDCLTEEAVRRYDDIITKMGELEKLRERSASNVVGISDIVKLIETRKLEIIDRTYKHVNRYLQEIWCPVGPFDCSLR